MAPKCDVLRTMKESRMGKNDIILCALPFSFQKCNSVLHKTLLWMDLFYSIILEDYFSE
jgi:pyrrolidone-carboxylate peptidase